MKELRGVTEFSGWYLNYRHLALLLEELWDDTDELSSCNIWWR